MDKQEYVGEKNHYIRYWNLALSLPPTQMVKSYPVGALILSILIQMKAAQMNISGTGRVNTTKKTW